MIGNSSPVRDEIAVGRLEELRLLRQTIFEAQRTRLQTLAFTLAAAGALLTLLFGGNSPPSAAKGFALVALVALVVISALVLTIRGTRGIDHAAGYLRVFVEDPADDIAWETRWAAFRTLSAKEATTSGAPRAARAAGARFRRLLRRSPRFGASRGYALAYGFIGVGLPYVWFAAVAHRHLWQSIFVFVEALVVAFFAADLFMRFTSGWTDPVATWRKVAASEARDSAARPSDAPHGEPA